MDKELGKTIKLFLLWWFLFLVPTIVGFILGRIFSKGSHDEIMSWSILVANVLIVIVFFSKRYVQWSFGRIERRMIWPTACMTILIAAAYLFVEEAVGELFFDL